MSSLGSELKVTDSSFTSENSYQLSSPIVQKAPPGTYIRVGQSRKLVGGKSLEVSCSPSTDRVSTPASSPDEVTFGQMLNAPCAGVGGGIGGGCGDCDDEYLLSVTALTFSVVPLNTFVRFRTPGTYTCEASSADITTAPRDEKIRPTFFFKSNPVILTIVNDPGWAHAAAVSYAGAYEKLCRGDDVAKNSFLQCSDLARRITYLDTVRFVRNRGEVVRRQKPRLGKRFLGRDTALLSPRGSFAFDGRPDTRTRF